MARLRKIVSGTISMPTIASVNAPPIRLIHSDDDLRVGHALTVRRLTARSIGAEHGSGRRG